MRSRPAITLSMSPSSSTERASSSVCSSCPLVVAVASGIALLLVESGRGGILYHSVNKCQVHGRRYRGRAMSDLPEDFQAAHLADVDPDIARVLDGELGRQQGTLEMIASENFVPQAVLDAAGSGLANKDAQGDPGKGSYGGGGGGADARELATAPAT